jgi:hypothetical protein
VSLLCASVARQDLRAMTARERQSPDWRFALRQSGDWRSRDSTFAVRSEA